MPLELSVASAKRWSALGGLLLLLSSALAQNAPGPGVPADPPEQRLRPQVRSQALPALTLSALQRQSIEPFLSAPQVFDTEYLKALPRIVGAGAQRNIFSKSDVVYALSLSGSGLTLSPGLPREWNIYRDPKALADPSTGEVLGWEAEYLGRARMLNPELMHIGPGEGTTPQTVVPARFEIVHAVSEIRAGDRLFQTNENAWRELTPHAPQRELEATIISIHGSGVANAAKNQIVVLNRGSKHGLEPGHVMSIRKIEDIVVSGTDASRPVLRPASGVTGQALVFLTFDKLAYALISEMSDPVQVGDRLTGP